MKRQKKFVIAGITGAMLVGAGTGALINIPTSVGASGLSIAAPGYTIGSTSDASTDVGSDHAGPGDFLKTQLDALVVSGTITQDQEDAILAGIEANRPAMGDSDGDHRPGMGGPGPMGGAGGPGPMGGMGHGGRGGGGLDAAATALGITSDELKTELEAGKTIADVATDKGLDVQTVIDAIVTEQTANITQRVTDMVNGVKPTPPADAPTTDAADPTATTTG